VTILAIASFAGVVALGLLAIGPFVMTLFLGHKVLGHHYFQYGRVGLAIVGIGMGFHLTAGTLNQALLARGRAHIAAAGWLTAAALFVVFVATPTISSQVTRVEVGYCGAAGVLCGLLFVAYRASNARPRGAT
jgi:O-antigen/teichoic acid export membrane protein